MAVVLVAVVVQDEPIKLEDFVAIANFTSGFLLPVLGIMLVTSEWSQRTAMVTFTLEPHRGRVVAAKLVAGLLLALLVSAIATLSALLVQRPVRRAARRRELELRRSSSLLGFLLTQVIAMLTGFAFATLFLNTRRRDRRLLRLRLILPTIFGVSAEFLAWFRDVQPWIDLSQAQEPLFEAAMTGEDWAQLLVTGLIWLGIPFVLRRLADPAGRGQVRLVGSHSLGSPS